jgi:hypothetical protein
VDVVNGGLREIDMNLKALLDKLIHDGIALEKVHENVSIIGYPTESFTSSSSGDEKLIG